jgi:hypothetical protein
VALVIWLLAGGGESELGEREGSIRGLVAFFECHFPAVEFKRITPVRNKRTPDRVKANQAQDALGKTGATFADQIKSKLDDAVSYRNPLCDALLIVDDLDCACHSHRTGLFTQAVQQAASGAFANIPCLIGFAAPELEAWIMADWGNTLAKHIDFRQCHSAMLAGLKAQGVNFDDLEGFSAYNEGTGACHEKLSNLLIGSSLEHNPVVYKKSQHSPQLLLDINPEIAAKKCPLFRRFFSQLQALTYRTQ